MTSLLIFLLVAGLCLGLGFTFWLLRNSLPLSEREIRALAVKHRMASVLNEFHFPPNWHTPLRMPADAVFKSKMSSSGKLYPFDATTADFPAIVASLFGGKRHEWLILAIAVRDRVVAVWINKGPDGTQVAPTADYEMLLHVAKSHRATALLEFHNHPGKHTIPRPSPQDLIACVSRGGITVERGMVYLAFVVGGATIVP